MYFTRGFPEAILVGRKRFESKQGKNNAIVIPGLEGHTLGRYIW